MTWISNQVLIYRFVGKKRLLLHADTFHHQTIHKWEVPYWREGQLATFVQVTNTRVNKLRRSTGWKVLNSVFRRRLRFANRSGNLTRRGMGVVRRIGWGVVGGVGNDCHSSSRRSLCSSRIRPEWPSRTAVPTVHIHSYPEPGGKWRHFRTWLWPMLQLITLMR